jgi:hypothetical protein
MTLAVRQNGESMSLELDHVFLATVDAAEVETSLRESGIVFSRRVRHQGQGTANACALFDNAFFEILWPDNDAEINSEVVQPLGLWQRAHWRETGACPFGIAFRPAANSSSAEMPPTWAYEAAYLPSGAGLPIITPKNAFLEPLVFISPGGKPPIATPGTTEEDLRQFAARRTLTAVHVTRPWNAPPLSAGLQWFCERGLFSFAEGDDYRMELELDHGIGEKKQAFDWPIPLSFRW